MASALAAQVRGKFKQRFQQDPVVVRSPGRVNVIGEHTDYNNGFVLPAAIDRAIYMGGAKRDDDIILLYSEEFHESHEVPVDQIQKSEKQWPNYILGVVVQLIGRGYNIGGFNLNIEGDVPIGAGLSSSAAVECATVFILDRLFDLGIPRSEMILIAQKAEHEFAGVMCGIMDQFASMFGKKDHVIKLDCLTLEYEYVPLRLHDYKIVLFNTNVKHALGDTEYNTRRNECAKGVEIISRNHPEVTSLRDVSMEMLDGLVKDQDPVIYARCKYVVEENQRLISACENLKTGNIGALGQNMFASHDGLSKEYEVSCRELDFLVDAVRNDPDVLGARMMGGGFGGCTINIVRDAAIPALTERLAGDYLKETGRALTAYIAETGDGTSLC